MEEKKKILILGAFDPIHPGHIDLFNSAKSYGEVHVGLFSDNALIQKKGFYFQRFPDRERLLHPYTDKVYELDRDATSFSSLIGELKPDYFGVGADGNFEYQNEENICRECGVETIVGLGGAKYASSTDLNAKRLVKTRWGSYDVLIDMPKLKVKILNIDPGKKLSLQKHGKRSEFFFMPATGEVRVNLPGVWHAPQAPVDRPLSILEVQIGEAAEDDKESISETDSEYDESVKKKIDLNY